jgi:Family of unknown function (DUF5681)
MVSKSTPPVKPKLKQRDATRIAAWRWQPGRSANPGGRPKHDLAREVARAIFENNMEALHCAYAKAALKGNAYCFKELADRAYGKIKEHTELTGASGGPLEYREISDEDLEKQIAQLEHQLGFTNLNERITQLERDLGLAAQIDEPNAQTRNRLPAKEKPRSGSRA